MWISNCRGFEELNVVYLKPLLWMSSCYGAVEGVGQRQFQLEETGPQVELSCILIVADSKALSFLFCCSYISSICQFENTSILESGGKSLMQQQRW
jgi:hypothetical protein